MFENIIGHDDIKRLFLDENYSIRNTYIFEGPDGIGKKTIALEIADKIAQYKQNILFIQSDKALGVDDIRPISDFIYNPPFGRNNRRVVIIDNAHTMNAICQNMLLKLLEIPPDFATFFLIVSDPSAILETISSRSQVLRLCGIKSEEIETLLPNSIKDSGLRKFISEVLNGSVAKALNIENSIDYFRQLYLISLELEKLNKEENIFNIFSRMSDVAKTADDLLYIYRWFAKCARNLYDKLSLSDNKYYQYAFIMSEAILSMNDSGDNILPIDIMLVKICKYNKKHL